MATNLLDLEYGAMQCIYNFLPQEDQLNLRKILTSYFLKYLKNPRVQSHIRCLSPTEDTSVSIQQIVIYKFDQHPMPPHKTPTYLPVCLSLNSPLHITPPELRFSPNCVELYRVPHYMTGIYEPFNGNRRYAAGDFIDYNQLRVASAFFCVLGVGNEYQRRPVAYFEDNSGRSCYFLEFDASVYAYYPSSPKDSNSKYVKLYSEVTSRIDGSMLLMADFVPPLQLQMMQDENIEIEIPRVWGNDITFADIMRFRDHVFFITWNGVLHVLSSNLIPSVIQQLDHENRDQRRRCIDTYRFFSDGDNLYLLSYMPRREMIMYQLVQNGGDFQFIRSYNFGGGLLVVMKNVVFSVDPMQLLIPEYELMNKILVFNDDFAPFDAVVADLYSLLSAQAHAALVDAQVAMPYDPDRVVDLSQDYGVMYRLFHIFTAFELE